MISGDSSSRSKSDSSDSLLSPTDNIVQGPNVNSEQKHHDTTINNNKIKQQNTPPPKPNKQQPSSQLVARRVKPRRVIGNYTLVSTLGSGSMGKVRLAIHNITQDKLAVKIVPRVCTQDKPSSEDLDSKKKYEKNHSREIRTIREASIMLLLHHPYIVSLKEMVVLDPYYYMFMEYVDGGQLLDFIISHGKLKERHARRFARQIISALDYCHRNSIVHRDLKIENILISSAGHIKIIDFGLSNLFSPKSHLSTFCGSLYFAAPELLNAKAYTGPEVDIWSFGIVLYVLVCGKVPFDDQNMAALHEKIKRGVVEYPSHLSSDCKNILSRMLVVNPSHRATTAEITIHPWMNKGCNEPIENYLPDRVPLTLPIDMEVVKGMTGFEFGTEEEIKEQLESIIQSDEYQKAAATLAERRLQSQQYQNQQQNHHHHTTNPLLLSSSSSRRRPTFHLPNDDPQSIPSAYHPLISIYYLVKEKMEREKQQQLNDDENNNNNSNSNSNSNNNNNIFDIDHHHHHGKLKDLKKYTRKLSISDHSTNNNNINNNNNNTITRISSSLNNNNNSNNDNNTTTKILSNNNNNNNNNMNPISPLESKNTISIPEAAHTTKLSTHQRHSIYDSQSMDNSNNDDITTGISYGENGKTKIHIDNHGHILELEKYSSTSDNNAHYGFGKLFNWHHGNHPIHSKNISSINHQHDESNDHINHTLQRLTQVVSHNNNNDNNVNSNSNNNNNNNNNSNNNNNNSMLLQQHNNNIKKSLRQRRHTNDDRTPSSSAYITELFPLPGNIDGSNTDPHTITFPSMSSPSSSTKYNDKRTPQHYPPLNINTSITKSPSATNSFHHHHHHDDEDHLLSPTKLGRKFSKMLSRRSNTGSITTPKINQHDQNQNNNNNNNNNSNNRNPNHRHTFHVPTHDHQQQNSTNINENNITKGHRPSKSGYDNQNTKPIDTLSSSTASSSSSQNHHHQEQHQHEQTFPSNVQGVAHHIQGTADEQIKPIFLKGLFSVSTTSTKHPSVIRADLIRVLERIGVKWRESKSRFECVHVPSIDMNHVMKNDGNDHPLHSNTSSTSFSNQPPPSPSYLQQQQQPSSLSSNVPNNSVTVPDLVVRFEIYIVKVPWLGMHGLQFRRVSGDTWQYKNMCSRILAELKL
ncbi:unnamed protein product [Cunninghamella blakesleeana]